MRWKRVASLLLAVLLQDPPWDALGPTGRFTAKKRCWSM